MAMETGYGIRKLRLIHARTLDLISLRQWGSRLKGRWHRTFEGMCFTFRDFQLAPTLEEYERILGMPLAKSPPYLFKGKHPS
ncbi:hypothetical protein CR513_04915, partial [Mucuna pruriens]